MAQGKQSVKGTHPFRQRDPENHQRDGADCQCQSRRSGRADGKNREYADTPRQIVSQILANNPESECVYLKRKHVAAHPDLYVHLRHGAVRSL